MLKFSVYHLFAFLCLFGTATMLQAQEAPSPLMVSYFDWSADGSRIAIGYAQWGGLNSLQSCGTGSDLKVFVVNTSQMISYPRTTTGCAPATAHFNATATTMVVVSSSIVERWDLNANSRTTSVQMETNFQAASHSPDGNLIAITNWANVSINSSSFLGGGRFRSPREDSTGVLVYSAWSPNGQMIATSTASGRIYVWRVADGRILAAYTRHTTPVKRLAWDPTSTQIISGDDSGNIWIWDAGTGQIVRPLTGNTGVVYDVDWSPNGVEVVSGGEDGLRVWNVVTGTGRLVHDTLTSAVAYNPTGTQLAVGGVITHADDLTITVIDAPPVLLPSQATTSPLIITDFDWSADGSRIAIGYAQWWENTHQSCGTGSDLKVFVVDTSQMISYPRSNTGCAPSTTDFNITATHVVAVSSSIVETWDLNYNVRTSGRQGETIFQAASYGPDGNFIAVTSWIGVSIWGSPYQGGFRSPREDSSGFLLYSAWSPNGQMIATSTASGRIYVWRIADGRILAAYTGHTTPVKRLAWDPTSTQIVSGDDSGNIWIWDAGTGQTVRPLTGHSGVVYDVDWSPNGADIVSGGEDGLRVWNVVTGTGRLVHDTLTSAVAYNPTGTQLAVGGVITHGDDLTISVIDAPPAVLEPTPTP